MLFQVGDRRSSGADSSPHTVEQGLYTEPASTSREAGELDQAREEEATSTPIGGAAAGVAGSRGGHTGSPITMICFLFFSKLKILVRV